MLSHDECWALLSAGASEQVEAVREDNVLYLMHLEKTCALALQASTLHVFCGARSYALTQQHGTFGQRFHLSLNGPRNVSHDEVAEWPSVIEEAKQALNSLVAVSCRIGRTSTPGCPMGTRR